MSEIRAVTAADLPALLALQRLAFQSEAALYPGQPLAPLTETLIELQRDCAGQLVLGLFEAGRLVGSVRGHVADGVGHIGRLMVHPEAQRRGLGRRLMAAIEAALDAPVYELFTGARSAGSLRLYRGLGYTLSGTAERGGVALVILSKSTAREVQA